jgi:hypothetical protein
MAFNNAIPQPTDLISTSQNDLLVNNQALTSEFGLDLGLHILTTAATDPTTTAAQIAIYAKTIGANLHFTVQPQSETNADGKPRIQMESFNPIAPLALGGNGPNLIAAATSGCSFLAAFAGTPLAPNGILIQWGSSGSISVLYPIVFAPTGAAGFQPIVVCTPTANVPNPPGSSSNIPYISAGPTNTGFTFRNQQGSSSSFCWVAIGPAS